MRRHETHHPSTYNSALAFPTYRVFWFGQDRFAVCLLRTWTAVVDMVAGWSVRLLLSLPAPQNSATTISHRCCPTHYVFNANKRVAATDARDSPH